MKTLNTILLLLLCLLYSCRQSDKNTPPVHTADTTRAADTGKTTVATTKKAVDTIVRPRYTADELYTLSKRNCPATIKKSAVATDFNGSRVLIVTIQNNTVKKIGAVKVSWILYNKTGSRVGYANGRAIKELAKGRSASYSWAIYPHSSARAKAFIYSIRYKDGSNWKVE